MNQTTFRSRSTAASALALLGALAVAARAEAESSCTAECGPGNGYEPSTCSYVAAGPAHYAGAITAGYYEIRLDGRLTVTERTKLYSAGRLDAAAGQVVELYVYCERGGWNVAIWAAGAVTAGDD